MSRGPDPSVLHALHQIHNLADGQESHLFILHESWWQLERLFSICNLMHALIRDACNNYNNKKRKSLVVLWAFFWSPDWNIAIKLLDGSHKILIQLTGGSTLLILVTSLLLLQHHPVVDIYVLVKRIGGELNLCLLVSKQRWSGQNDVNESSRRNCDRQLLACSLLAILLAICSTTTLWVVTMPTRYWSQAFCKDALIHFAMHIWTFGLVPTRVALNLQQSCEIFQ